ncbi:alpha/beta fold hydrolase [Bordetella tumulicola]|uniref:alpha/beta fold hydrolase n=1 Tax=Bordetella tumulicola TaxID=1649133 RepID=UPI0039EF4C82
MTQSDPQPTVAATRHAMPEGRWVDVAGVRTRYFEAGTGEPVVFVYGGNFGMADGASSAYTWSLNLQPLAQAGYRAIAFDKLGQGETGNPERDEHYTMQAVVDHAAAFLRALDLPPVHLVGHSRGGYAATRMTLQHHDAVRTLTIVNSGTLSPGVGTNEVVLCNPPHRRGSREAVRWVYENYSHNPGVVTEEWIDAVMHILSLEKYRHTVQKMATEGLAERVFLPELAHQKGQTLRWLDEGRLQRPMQIIWGYNDRTAVLERGMELFRMVSRHQHDAQFHVINESGHFPFREHPAQFNALLARFFALQPAPGR